VLLKRVLQLVCIVGFLHQGREPICCYHELCTLLTH
jgi:hypothetical protein